jgi:hypothetical protein
MTKIGYFFSFNRLFVALIVSFFLFPCLGYPDVIDDEVKSARKQTTFGIYPPVIDLECKAGERVATTVKIDNPNSKAAAFHLDPVGVTAHPSNQFLNKPIASLPTDHLSRHITIEAREIAIPAQSYKNIAVYVDVPASLKGTHYTGLTVVNMSPSVTATGLERKAAYEVDVGVGLQPSIGVTIKCHIKGTLKYAYSVKRIEIVPKKGNQPVSAHAELVNTGNAEMSIIPNLILIDKNKKVVARMKTTRGIKLIPGGTKDIEFQPTYRDIPPGSYKAVFSSATPELSLPPIEKTVVLKR